MLAKRFISAMRQGTAACRLIKDFQRGIGQGGVKPPQSPTQAFVDCFFAFSAFFAAKLKYDTLQLPRYAVIALAMRW